MELGLMGIDGFDQSILQGKPNYNDNHGSGLIKKERSDPFDDNVDGILVSKVAKQIDDFGLRSDSISKQQMLNFSSYSSENMNGGLHGSFTGIRGPFTPAQWIELEHQAMIYKYFTSNVPVPSNLLIPIRKAIQSTGFPGFSIGSYPSPQYGWGAFHLGFAGNTDPEPGRCRRTDGKKWRCSRDAVPDQKYCERHINRGRHRSRKPVEGHTGQAASGATATTKVLPAMSSSMSSLVTQGGGASIGVDIAHPHIKGLPPVGAINDSTDPNTECVNNQQGLSMMRTTINLESKDSQYSIPKQHTSFDDSSVSGFGVVSDQFFLDPRQKSSYLDCKSYNNSLMEYDIQQTHDQCTLRHLIDNSPKDQGLPSVSWSKDPKSDWTQISMSIPVLTYFSSSSSPNHEKNVSPLRMGTIVSEGGTKQNAQTPVSWGNANSMGGPLGEVFLSNANSPTGVLQKSTLVSVSNSSSCGSPRDGANDDMLGSAACATSASTPSV